MADVGELMLRTAFADRLEPRYLWRANTPGIVAGDRWFLRSDFPSTEYQVCNDAPGFEQINPDDLATAPPMTSDTDCRHLILLLVTRSTVHGTSGAIDLVRQVTVATARKSFYPVSASH